MLVETKRSRGGQPGNQNHRIHGFYSCQLSDMEQQDLAEAALVQDIDTEIAIVRLKLRNLLIFDPENVRLIFMANSNLISLLLAKDRLYVARKEGSDEFDRHAIAGFGARGFVLPPGYDPPVYPAACSPEFNPWSCTGDS